ncbi:MAG: reaction center protein L chain [Gammaproteobacteria bacterium]|nr:MAG: reaction center protein L chain [Gammaproteobacteria bacterium]
MGPTWNIWQINIAPQIYLTGWDLRLLWRAASGKIITICATLAFASWAMRQVEISRKLGWAKSPSLSASKFPRVCHFGRRQARFIWARGFWFPLYGILSHLDWVNVGYQFLHFHYNPAHMIAVTFFFTTALALSMHGSLILMATDPRGGKTVKTGEQGRSSATISATPLGFGHSPFGFSLPSRFCLLECSVPIVISGPFWTRGWPKFGGTGGSKLPVWY